MRVPAPARPCRALHVALSQGGSTTRDQCPGFLQDADGIDPRRRTCHLHRCEGRWPFVHRRDVGAQAEPCGDARDKGAGQSVGRWRQSRGRAATAANSMRAIPKAHAPGLRPAAHPGCAPRSEAARDVRRPARRSRPSPHHPIAPAVAPVPGVPATASRPARAVPARQTRRARPATTCDGRRRASRPTPARPLARARIRAAGPHARDDATMCAIHYRRRRPHSRRAALAIGGRRAPSARAPRAAGGTSRIPSPGPGLLLGSGAPSTGSVGINPRDRRRGSSACSPQTTPCARRNAGRLAAWALSGSAGSGGRSAYASNHSFALTKPKSTQGASAGCHSRHSRATISGQTARATSSSTRRSIHTRPRLPNRATCRRRARQSAWPSAKGCAPACHAFECKKRDDVLERASRGAARGAHTADRQQDGRATRAPHDTHEHGRRQAEVAEISYRMRPICCVFSLPASRTGRRSSR